MVVVGIDISSIIGKHRNSHIMSRGFWVSQCSFRIRSYVKTKRGWGRTAISKRTSSGGYRIQP